MIITLLTDFGFGSYTAQVKGVILEHAPQATIVDITHAVAPGDVEHAAWIWRDSYGAFPDGTIHVGVVDPGVGTDRRAIAVRLGRHYFVAPDNGLMTHILRERDPADIEAVALRQLGWRETTSPVFHGRDVFAPVAGRLATKAPLQSLGAGCAELVRLAYHSPKWDERTISGQVIFWDHFGNCVTDIPASLMISGMEERGGTRDNLITRVGELEIRGLMTHYAEAEDASPLLLVGSHRRLEIAVRNGNAQKLLGIRRHAAVHVMLG